MLELRESRPNERNVIGAMGSGAFLAAIGVAAMAVWAVNLEPILSGNFKGGIAGFVLRLLLCEAVPLAALGSIFRGVCENQGTEAILRRVVRTVFWCLGGFVLSMMLGNESLEEEERGALRSGL